MRTAASVSKIPSVHSKILIEDVNNQTVPSSFQSDKNNHTKPDKNSEEG